MKSVAQWAAVVVVMMSAAAFGGCDSSVTEEDGAGGAGGSSTSSTGSCVDASCAVCPDVAPDNGAACSGPGAGTACTYATSDDCSSVFTCEGGTWSLGFELVCDEPPVVECELGGGPAEGDPCEMIGELCDNPGGCPVTCGVDYLWHDACPTCPDEVPVAGDLCDPALDAPCPYTVDAACGPKPATATCDLESGAWIVAIEPC